MALRDQIGGSDLEALRRLADDQKELEAQSPTSLVLLAMGLIGRGDRERAERVLRCAWRLDPGDFWVNYELGQVHKIEDHYTKPEEAIRFGSAAVAIRPRSFAAHNSLGIALKDARKLEEAAAEFRAALQLRPDHAYARNNLGNILAEQGKFEEAMAEFREALRLQPDYASPHDGLGNALLRRRGSRRKRSPNTARPCGSSPISPWPTATSATPCASRGSSTRRSPHAARPCG